MINNNLDQQLNSRVSPEILIPPKWLLIVFKIYGGFLLISITFSLSSLLPIFVAGSHFLSLTPSLLKTLIIPLMFSVAAFILGWGSWHLKRWVIPLFLISPISGLITVFIIRGFGLNLSDLSFFITIVLFAIAFRYRQYFSGSYKKYIIQGVFILALIITNILAFQPAGIFSSISEKEIDNYIENLIAEDKLKDEGSKKLLQEKFNKAGINLTDQQINEMINFPAFLETTKQSLKNSSEFRNLIRIILESEEK